ncbi:KIR protein [Plasmodium coatneyi]|uniref:KIR protein n=1 Tax=Plasmodium coatneyi TaxID=208452 RepID=A0A1B1E6Z9_9APIC|nr:KIR protein [Plasmodium coatneyi]ANQ10814.1 KIR protein [Plasmodium coatneyi]
MQFYRTYKKLRDHKDLCNGDNNNLPPEIEEALADVHRKEEYTKMFKERWCYASKGSAGEEVSLSQEQRCGFLYYWIGNIFHDIFNKDESFWNFMNKIRGELNKLSTAEMQCDIVCSHINKSDFQYDREVYDFLQDYRTINEKSGKSEYVCSKELSHYLDTAALAYNQMNGQCKNGSIKSTYCSKFNSDYKDLILRELRNSKCTPKHAQGILHDAEGPVSATVAIPSVLTVIGLPSILFLLYKYTSLPSWFHNQFGRGSSKIRKRRSDEGQILMTEKEKNNNHNEANKGNKEILVTIT